MVFREQDKHFLWALISAIGIILVWKGLWEGLYEIPYLGDSWVALFVGLTMLTLSGLIFREFDPLGGIDKSINRIVKQVSTHPKRQEFQIKYQDKIKKKEMVINASDIKYVEKDSLVVLDAKSQQELFIPVHRITEVVQNGKTYWKL